MPEAAFKHYHSNSRTVVPVSLFNCCETLFALLRYGDSKLIAETSFLHVIPAFRDPAVQRVPISRDRNRQKIAWEQPQEITYIVSCKFTSTKTFLPDVRLAFKKHVQKLFHNIPTLI